MGGVYGCLLVLCFAIAFEFGWALVLMVAVCYGAAGVDGGATGFELWIFDILVKLQVA